MRKETTICISEGGSFLESKHELILRNIQNGVAGVRSDRSITIKEKSDAVYAELREHPDWSDRKIGRECGVAHKMVSRRRKILKSEQVSTKDIANDL